MTSQSQNDFLGFEKFYNGITRANIQPSLLFKIPVCPHKFFFKHCHSSRGRFTVSFPGNGANLLALRMYPRLWKVNSKVTTKTTFRKKLDFLSREGSLGYRFNKARNIYQHSNIIKVVETIHITIGHGVTYKINNIKIICTEVHQRQGNHSVVVIHLIHSEQKK